MSSGSRTLRALAVSVVFGLLAIACSGAAETDVSAAPATTFAAETATDETNSDGKNSIDDEVVEPAETTTTAVEAVAAASETTTAPTTTTTAVPESSSPAFQGDFVDLNGQTVALSDFEGQDVVLWFWAPW